MRNLLKRNDMDLGELLLTACLITIAACGIIFGACGIIF